MHLGRAEEPTQKSSLWLIHVIILPKREGKSYPLFASSTRRKHPIHSGLASEPSPARALGGAAGLIWCCQNDQMNKSSPLAPFLGPSSTRKDEKGDFFPAKEIRLIFMFP